MKLLAQRHILWGLRPQTPGTSRPPASVNTFLKNVFLDILAPGRAMHHPDGLLGKRSFFLRKTKRPCEVTRCTGRLAFIRS